MATLATALASSASTGVRKSPRRGDAATALVSSSGSGYEKARVVTTRAYLDQPKAGRLADGAATEEVDDREQDDGAQEGRDQRAFMRTRPVADTAS